MGKHKSKNRDRKSVHRKSKKNLRAGTKEPPISPDNIKFFDFLEKEFQEYGEEMKKMEKKYSCDEKKEIDTCGANTITLQPYQKLPLAYLQNNISSLLAFFQIGSGKTFVGVSTAVGLNRPTIIIAPSKLLGDWLTHIIIYSCDSFGITMEDWKEAQNDRKKMAEIKKKVSTKYTFISLNAANAGEKLRQQQPLKGKLIIVDECQQLGSQIVNSTRSDSSSRIIANLLMSAPDIKMLFLSGSPISSEVYSIAILLSILKQYIYVGRERYTLFPEDYDTFAKYFINYKTLKIKNKNIFQERSVGLISYFSGIKDENNMVYPSKIGPIINKVALSGYQWGIYSKFRSKEIEEERKQSHAKKEAAKIKFGIPKKDTSSSYKVRSRQALDFVLPSRDINGEMIFYPKKALDENGWKKLFNRIDPKDLKINELHNYSPKMYDILNYINSQPKGISIVYSTFIAFGISIFSKILSANGYIEYTGKEKPEDFMQNIDNSKNQHKVFALLSGKTDPVKMQNIMRLEKHPLNLYGKYLRIVEISSALSEGISFLSISDLHIMEAQWKMYKQEQIIGRAIRFCSHSALPQDERTVKVFVYLGIAPSDIDVRKVLGEKTNNPRETSDTMIYEQSLRNQKLIDSFLLAMKEVAIDCNTFKDYNFDEELTHCVKCDDTSIDEKIYYPNITKHINMRIASDKYCIPKTEIDELIGPIFNSNYGNNMMFVYDPMTKIVYLVRDLKPIGKYDPATKMIRDRESDKNVKIPDNIADNIYNMKGIIQTRKYDAVVYNPSTKNAYAITDIEEAGIYDADEKSIDLNDTFDPDVSKLEMYARKSSKNSSKKSSKKK